VPRSPRAVAGFRGHFAAKKEGSKKHKERREGWKRGWKRKRNKFLVKALRVKGIGKIWWSGVVVSALASINEVNLRRARLVLRWARRKPASRFRDKYSV